MSITHRIIALVVFSVAVFSVALRAQENKQTFSEAVGVYTPKYACEQVQVVPSKSLIRVIDVLSYSVYLDLYDGLVPIDTGAKTAMRYAASVDVRLVVLSDTLSAVAFDVDPITIRTNSTTVNGMASSFRRSGGKLLITPPSAIKTGDTLTLHVTYTVTRVPGEGLVVCNGHDLTAAAGSHPIAFTFSEPENSRRWFPCNDRPDDKAFFTAVARIPKDHRLVSNGTLQHTSLDGDTAKIETWSSPEVMPPYLFAMNASKYTQIYQLYTRADGTGVPIRNFQWDTDESGVFRARYAVRNVPAMFAAFEPKFGRYPFRTYGHVAVHPVNIGGMEHQSMTTVTRKWLEGNAEVGYAHELGHQWLGDMVTCATWGDIWLNEGGATFSEAIWREYNEGPDGYRDQMMRRRTKYMEQGQNSPPVWDIPIGNLFNEATTYAKAAWIYHMMRRMLTDSVFFPALQAYLQTYRGRSIQTADFEAFWKAQIPDPEIDWDVFFHQWLVQRGHPFFWVRVERDINNPDATRLRIDQIQISDGVPEVFQVPYRIELYSAGVHVGAYRATMRQRSTEVSLNGLPPIDSIEFDPDMLSLHEVLTDVTVGIADDAFHADGLSCPHCPSIQIIGANPAASSDAILLGVENTTDNSVVRLIDMRGQEVWTQQVGAGENVVYVSDAQISAGAYVAILSTRWGSATARVIVR